MNKALSTYTAELANVTKDNAAALFASATLTAVYLFRTTRMDMDELRSSLRRKKSTTPQDDIVQKMFTCAMRPIWGLRGPLTVLMSGWMWVWSGKMQSVAARSWWPTHIVPATPQAITEDERLAALKDSWAADADGNEELTQALEYLRESFALVSQLTLPNTYAPVTSIPYSIDSSNTTCTLTDRGAIFVWATQVSRSFMQRIEAQYPHALVLLAHYAILPGRVRDVWWLEGLGADIVTAIALVLGEERRSLIEWPASVVGVDLGNLGSERKDWLEGRPEEMGMDVI
jgi:peptide alpha-N-acetyltransferase